MPQLLVGSGVSSNNLNQGTFNTYVLASGDDNFTGAPENVKSRPTQFVGVFNNIHLIVTANGVAGVSTLQSRKNAANGQQVQTFNGGFTGLVEDTSNSDALAVNDTIAPSISVGASGTTITWTQQGMAQNPSSGQAITTYIGSNPTATLSNNKNTYNVGATRGTTSVGAESAFQQQKIRSPGTIKSFFADILSNTRTGGTSAWKSRKDGADGGLAISVDTGTGQYHDTTGSDTVVAGTLMARSVDSDGNTGTAAAQSWWWDHIATASQGDYLSSLTLVSVTLNAATVYYNGIQSRITQDTVEANRALKMRVAGTAKLSQLYASANGITGASTVILRRNSGGETGGISISIPGSGSFGAGWIEDITHSEVYAAADTGDWQLSMGAGGTNAVVDYLIFEFDVTPPTVVGAGGKVYTGRVM